MRNTILFAYSTNSLVRLLSVNMKNNWLSYPQNLKMCDPILVILLKMQPHYSQSSHENATPPSGTFQLASHKKIPTLPLGWAFLKNNNKSWLFIDYIDIHIHLTLWSCLNKCLEMGSGLVAMVISLLQGDCCSLLLLFLRHLQYIIQSFYWLRVWHKWVPTHFFFPSFNSSFASCLSFSRLSWI